MRLREDPRSIGDRGSGPALVFRNASIIDGTGSPTVRGDVGITGERIVAMAPPNTLGGAETIDVTDRILAPGFVEIHSHADYTLLADGRAHNYTLQGVTSVVTGNCGHGVAPVTESSRDLVPTNIFGWKSDWEVQEKWTTFGDYMELLRRRGTAVNVFPLVPHGALRLAVAGFAPRELASKEIDTMRGLTAEAMESGAVGLSTGLEYAPGIAATTEEIARAAEPVGRFDGFYATHCRNRAEAMVKATTEAVEIALRSGSRLQLSHFVRRPWADRDIYPRALEVAFELPKRGLQVRFDILPFDYGPSPLAFVLPSWARDGSREAIAARIADKSNWPRMMDELPARFVTYVRSGIADSMYIAADGADGEFVGSTLGEIAKSRSTTIPEAVFWLLARAGTDFYSAAVLARFVETADLHAALADENFFIMGDGTSAALDGPLANYCFAPSDWGYTAVMLGHYVRTLGLTSLESAVARMTSAPAEQIGLVDRGQIREGFAADLVVFDPRTIGADITPAKLVVRPKGIDHVVVNGRVVVRSGVPTTDRPGIVGLKRH